jgi:hypothetical protein
VQEPGISRELADMNKAQFALARDPGRHMSIIADALWFARLTRPPL